MPCAATLARVYPGQNKLRKHQTVRRIAIPLLAVSLGVIANAGADGMLDPSFGNGGLVVTTFPGNPLLTFDGAAALVILPDGRAVAAGSVGDPDGHNMGAARYMTSGALDTTFSGGGLAIVGGCSSIGDGGGASAALLQPDGRLVLVGECPGGFSLSLARLNVDGSLDTSFGTGGQVLTPIPPGPVFAAGGLLQPDGKIVVVGFGCGGGACALKAARYNPGGSLDPSFGTAGTLTLPLAQSFLTQDAVLQADGKLVIAGTYGPSAGPHDFALVRLLPSGAPDLSFDGDGLATASFGGNESVWSVIVLPDGRIVIGGKHNTDFGLVRFLPGGSLDTTFGAGGLATASNGGPVSAGDVIRLPNDNLMIAGSADGPGAAKDFLLARFLPGGALDTSFGTAGFLRTDFSASQEGCAAVALAAPDRILTAGTISSPPGFPGDFALARYIATTPVELLMFEVQ